MIKGQNIICFGSEIWGYSGLQQTVMKLLSQHNRILFVNPIGTRKISLQLAQFSFYFNRIKRTFNHNSQKKHEKIENVMFCNPWVIPLVYNGIAKKISRILIRKQFNKLLDTINFDNYILWIGTPTAEFLIDLFDPILLLYNPVDRYYAFSFVNSEKILRYERNIASKAGAIICTADAIKNDLLPYNKNSFTVTHGVDTNHFISALDNKSVPGDIKDIQKPIIGFFGGLSQRVNFDLLYKTAIQYPNANMVLIGQKYADVEAIVELESLPNVHLLGHKDFSILPLYLKHFTVCLIPYVVNERLVAVDPIKLREYLSMGKPVVSVDLPEVRKLENYVYVGENEADFVEKVGKALEEEDESLVEKRIDTAKQSDWSVKIEEISTIIVDALARKQSPNANLNL